MKVYCVTQRCDAAVSDLLNATSLQAVQGVSACFVIIALTLLWSSRTASRRRPLYAACGCGYGVLHAWTHHLAPAASARTFYQLLRGRAEFRDRR